MSSKAVAVAAAALILIAFALWWRARSLAPEGSASQPSPARPAAAGDQLATRPNVFGTGLDTSTGLRADQPAGGGKSQSRPPVDARANFGHRKGSALPATGNSERFSLDLRDRLRDPSRLLLAQPDNLADPAGRPSTASAWRAESDLEILDLAESERTDPGQAVLSLFDGDDGPEVLEASVERGVVFEEAGARFSPNSEFAIPMAGKISGEAGSISFWVRPEGETSDVDNASLVQLRSHYKFADRLQIWKDGGAVRLVFADSTGTESGVTHNATSWAPQEWRLVTATWGNGENALYINGELVGKSQYEGGFRIQPDTLLHIGSNYSEDPRSLTGTISRFRVYDRPLEAEEIAALPSEYPE